MDVGVPNLIMDQLQVLKCSTNSTSDGHLIAKRHIVIC